jgi:deoxyribonuclease-4
MAAFRRLLLRFAAMPRASTRPQDLLGAHMSIAGGVDLAVERAAEVGCHALQIFCKSSNQWKARPLPAEEVERFRRGVREKGLGAVVAHSSYLINLGSPDAALWKRSIAALAEELERCEELGVPWLIVHPGAHMGAGIDAGVRRIASGLDAAFRRTPGLTAGVLLETAAGQGSAVGSRFEEIAGILAAAADPERLGACLDTCHIFAAGYDLRTRAGWDDMLEQFDRHVGLPRLRALHVNDSLKGCGSRVDRHEAIGDGELGLWPFLFLMNEPALKGRPLLLETPKSDDGAEDRRNLRTLRSLVGRTSLPRPPAAAGGGAKTPGRRAAKAAAR